MSIIQLKDAMLKEVVGGATAATAIGVRVVGTRVGTGRRVIRGTGQGGHRAFGEYEQEDMDD